MTLGIYQKIENNFGENAREIHEELETLDAKTKGMIGNRIILAIDYLAKGDVSTFHEKVKLAQVDWRDVLIQAEYDYPENERLRDFDKTFYELGLLKSKNT